MIRYNQQSQITESQLSDFFFFFPKIHYLKKIKCLLSTMKTLVKESDKEKEKDKTQPCLFVCSLQEFSRSQFLLNSSKLSIVRVELSHRLIFTSTYYLTSILCGQLWSCIAINKASFAHQMFSCGLHWTACICSSTTTEENAGLKVDRFHVWSQYPNRNKQKLHLFIRLY